MPSDTTLFNMLDKQEGPKTHQLHQEAKIENLEGPHVNKGLNRF